MNDPSRSRKPFPITAIVSRAPGAAGTLEEVLIAPPRPDELLVRNVATGICHTDIAAMQARPSPQPIVLGHEGSAIVEAVGDEVEGLAPGDHVIMSYLACGDCGECASGHQSSCGQAGRLCFSGARPDGSHALTSVDGSALNDRFFGQSSFAQYSIANRNNVVKVSKDLPLETLGPLGCGIMTGAGAAWNVLEVETGMSFAVFGSGAVGLSSLIAARIAGATRIVAIDRVASRLELARSLGATHVIDASREDVTEGLRTIAPAGIDRILETTGRADVVQSAVTALAQRGVLAVAAHAEEGVKLDIRDLILGSRSIRGVAEGGRSAQMNIERILGHFAKGEFPFDRLIKFYPYAEFEQAIADSVSGAVIKPVIRWS
ncbi:MULTISPECIES: NAD(P)-dependent alcohol dehydrogenase [Sphingobium]|uniref:NAD(P)-dependent alcohol dehydrogenase n=1 Tax=Sphingobium TaxID=165695 RepID=UPI00159C236F|nr:NAD(P)-dependent alcohol dehydrogenase [Sphingobium sp. 15-1]